MTDRRKVKQLIKLWVALGVIALIVGYGAFQAKNLVGGPKIAITSPMTGATTTESMVNITGFAHNISFLTLNGDKIFTNESGAFSEKVLLSYGYNIMTLEAKDRFGRTAQKTLQLIYK